MIGVLAKAAETAAVAEFFELFKTPWEFAQEKAQYDVLICTRDELWHAQASLVLLYGSEGMDFDREHAIEGTACPAGGAVSYAKRRLPLYGRFRSFSDAGGWRLPRVGAPSESLACRTLVNDQPVIRIGYDLFDEVRLLLTVGQPEENAAIPTLELHISLLRDLILRSDIALAEIPPTPAGYSLVVCLTHDVDHPRLVNHRMDHTMWGFVYRAVFGSVRDVLSGRQSASALLKNWWTVCLLPFIYLGLVRDPWNSFSQYMDIEEGLGATYFILPRKGDAGVAPTREGHAPRKRAAGYAPDEVSSQLPTHGAGRVEIALHGIDAWNDVDAARAERTRLTAAGFLEPKGVRMHWLYFDEGTPAALDRAGFDYDSTFGYNATVGYRAGTAQAFRPFGASSLMELPLIVMDTALFYPAHQHLKPAQARQRTMDLVEDLTKLGGTLTVNWHDRSIGPERWWDRTYNDLLDEVKDMGAWFSPAADVVRWYRLRRSAVLQTKAHRSGELGVTVRVLGNAEDLPELQLRIWNPVTTEAVAGLGEIREWDFEEVPIHIEFDSTSFQLMEFNSGVHND